MKNFTITIDSTLARSLLIGAAIVFLLLPAYFFIKWSFANMAAMRTDLPEIADLATRLGPDDSQTHFTAAALYEKTFLPEDFERSLSEYEKAAALSPANYLLWLELGKARERAGDTGGAEAALRYAVSLAPNYAAPHWALGNTLVRQGKTGEGFAELRAAAAANPAFAAAAVRSALQALDGELAQIGNAIGDGPEIRAALITELTRAKRLDEAFRIWKNISPHEQTGPLAEASGTLLAELITAKKFAEAFEIELARQGRDPQTPAGTLANGGFEDEIKSRGASIFEWQIADGAQPQIVISDGQKHGGARSLLIVFNSSDPKDFRSIAQHVPVEPGKNYEFTAYYRAELKAAADVKWEIADADTSAAIASTNVVSNTADWVELRCRFTSPKSGAVIVRFVRENCASAICPMIGRLWFDDLAVRAF